MNRLSGQLRAAVSGGARSPQELFFELGLEDIRRAAEVLRPVYDGVSAFCDSYRQLLDCIESKLAVLPVAAAAG